MEETLYEVVVSGVDWLTLEETEETIYVRTDMDMEIWAEEYEAMYGKVVVEYDKVEELLTGLESAVNYMEWWAA